jgi:hypothetical protein
MICISPSLWKARILLNRIKCQFNILHPLKSFANSALLSANRYRRLSIVASGSLGVFEESFDVDPTSCLS